RASLRPLRSPLFPYTPLFRAARIGRGPRRSGRLARGFAPQAIENAVDERRGIRRAVAPRQLDGLIESHRRRCLLGEQELVSAQADRKSTRLNSSHQLISYAVF